MRAGNDSRDNARNGPTTRPFLGADAGHISAHDAPG